MEFLRTGSTVEVRSEEEGFQGAWYPAKILTKFSTKQDRILVEYSDDQFREYVHVSSIRPPPPPPPADQSYDPFDVVDAFHGGGWWKGVVSKVEVLEDRNTVVFENPFGQFDFRSRDLRFHLLWIDGKWVKSPKLKSMEGLKIGVGMDVAASEVDFEDSSCTEAEMSAALTMANRGDQEGNVDSGIVKKQEVPFTKSSSFWQYVESHNIFQVLPQKPHFRPLHECNELRREGLAIGHMVSFITLVENVTKLPAKEPRQALERYLEALADLEKLGFDVKAVVDRINKLILIKSGKEPHETLWKEIQSKIAQCEREQAIIEEEISVTDKMISQLKIEKAMKMPEKVLKDSKSNSLQMNAKRLKDEISNLLLDFERQATAPL